MKSQKNILLFLSCAFGLLLFFNSAVFAAIQCCTPSLCFEKSIWYSNTDYVGLVKTLTKRNTDISGSNRPHVRLQRIDQTSIHRSEASYSSKQIKKRKMRRKRTTSVWGGQNIKGRRTTANGRLLDGLTGRVLLGIGTNRLFHE